MCEELTKTIQKMTNDFTHIIMRRYIYIYIRIYIYVYT